MRLSHALMMIAASFLLTTEVLSAAANSNQDKITKMASPGGPSHRLLRTVPGYDENESEERASYKDFSTTDKNILKTLAQELGFDLNAAMKNTSIFHKIKPSDLQTYHNKLEEIRQKYKRHKPPMINYGD